ncbi:MAG: riboflavin synthase [Saprospiraceae bacterium]|nr:riboflavin synthase [Saprospiraceae bacterium]
MFTGIIERLGKIKSIVQENSNYHFTIHSGIESELYIDQSIAHNGVCLTIVELNDESYVVTAIKETMIKTNLGTLSVGDEVNLERATLSGQTRMDGHIVQGHVDGTTTCTKVSDENGSWYFTFQLNDKNRSLVVDKGSVCINGVSLTVVNPTKDEFSVAIIPYTYAHTNFKDIKKGDTVNLEFDIIGKYVQRYLENIKIDY